MTMVQQSVKMGLPSVQLEIPLKMRKELTTNKRLLDNLADSIWNVYLVIKSHWLEYESHQHINYNIKFANQILINTEISLEVLEQLARTCEKESKEKFI